MSVFLSLAVFVTNCLLLIEEGQMSSFKYRQLASYPMILSEERDMFFLLYSISIRGNAEKIYFVCN